MAEASDYVAYLQKMVNLDTLDKMTRALDEQLQGSRQMLSQIQTMLQSIPNQNEVLMENSDDQEDLNKFDADVPKLVMPDMESAASDVDLDDIIASVKVLAENLKQNISVSQSQASSKPPFVKMTGLELDEDAASLELLNKRLMKLKLTKSEEVQNRNPELEDKLTQLCLAVNAFTQVYILSYSLYYTNT